jgi:hypothetical protein
MNIHGIGQKDMEREYKVVKMFNKYDFIDACYIGERIEIKYKNNKYIINTNSEGIYYIFDVKKGTYQYFKNKDDLFSNGCINEKRINDILDEIKIQHIEFNNKKRFVAATLMNREIEFEYENINYFKSSENGKYYVYCYGDGKTQYFNTPQELLNKCKLNGKLLKDLYDEIYIQCIL